jgi:hypothetical protein
MGACTTIYVSRDALIRFMIDKIYRSSDRELEDLADTFLRERLYNCSLSFTGEDDQTLRYI